MWIDLYTRCWNDSAMLGFFFRHYDDLVQRYIVFDDGSTDNSLGILAANPKVEIRRPPERADPESRILSSHELVESCWKESRGLADFVIVTDIDEHIHHPEMQTYLAACKRQGVTIIPSLGYQMMSEEFPQRGLLLRESLTRGAPFLAASKMNIFSPDDIETTRFGLGRHSAAPLGNVVAPARDELKLLHYKYLGFERTQRRHEEYLTRQRKKDLARGLGYQYSWARDELALIWSAMAAQLVDVREPYPRETEETAGPLWWDAFRQAG